MDKIQSIFKKIGKIMNIVSILALLVMVCLTMADIILRLFFKSPITGTIEIVRMMMICMSTSFVAALMEGRHVDVDILVSRFNKSGQTAFAVFGYILTAIVSGLMCYQGFVDAAKKMKQNQVYTMLKIPTFPFYLIFAIAMGVFAISVIVCLINVIRGNKKAEEVIENES